MCLLFLTCTPDPPSDGYKLILASNRDEFYARPTRPAHAWTESPNIWGGRDMEPGREGGTWLAIGNHGGTVRLGALLNITGEPHSDAALGRGFLIGNYVDGTINNAEYSHQLVHAPEEYNAYNLLTVELKKSSASTIHCSNAPPTQHTCPTAVPLAFGNSPPNTPLAKVIAGQSIFSDILQRLDVKRMTREQLVAELIQMMSQRKEYWPDAELQRRAPNWAKSLSSVCVNVPHNDYGTRTHSVILIDANDRMDYYEHTMDSCDPAGTWLKTHLTEQLEITD